MAETIRDVVKYCLTEGQKVSGKMGYIPLPDKVVQVVSNAHRQHPVEARIHGIRTASE